MIAKRIYILLLILINFYQLRRTIFSKLNNLLKKKSEIVYPIDKDNNRMDDEIDCIHKAIKEEIRSAKIYSKKNISNNILKSWKNYDDKKNKSFLVSNIINKYIPSNQKLVENNLLEKLRNLDTNGIIKLENLNFDTKKVSGIKYQIENCKIYPSHVPMQSTSEKIEIKDIGNSNFGTYDMDEVFKNEDLTKLLFNKDIIKIIESYFNCTPTLCSVNLYWNFQNNQKNLGPQFFHRDVDDLKIINVFVLLSDTSQNNGGYLHVKGSHNKEQLQEILKKNNKFINSDDIFNLPMNGYGFEKLYVSLFKDKFIEIYGKAGQVILADGYGLHKAVRGKNDRLMFWGTYSMSKNSCEMANKPLQKKIPYKNIKDFISKDIKNKYIGRYLIDFTQD